MVRRSPVPSREWRVSGFVVRPVLTEAQDDAPRGPSNFKSVDFIIMQNYRYSTVQHVATVWPVVMRGVHLLSAICDCPFIRSADLPCTHATRFSTLYEELSGNNQAIAQHLQTQLRLEISSMMHAH